MSRTEFGDWIFGIVLLSIGGSVGLFGIIYWVWFEFYNYATDPITVQDVLFRYSVPAHFRSGILESLWWRVLDSTLPWFAFVTGAVLSGLGAVPLHRANQRRCERRAAASEVKPSPPPPEWMEGKQANPFAATAARASLTMPFLTARMERLRRSEEPPDPVGTGPV